MSLEKLDEFAPDFAKEVLPDVMPSKVRWVQGVEDRGAIRSGYQLLETGKWHVFQRAVDQSDGTIYEWMMKDGVPHGLYRRFYAKGSYETGSYYNG